MAAHPLFPELPEARTARHMRTLADFIKLPAPALSTQWPREFSPHPQRECIQESPGGKTSRKLLGVGIKRGTLGMRKGLGPTVGMGEEGGEGERQRWWEGWAEGSQGLGPPQKPLMASACHSPEIPVQLRLHPHLCGPLWNVCFHHGRSPVPPSTKKTWTK